MKVVQTNGQSEEFNPNKILYKIKALSEGLNIDSDNISQLIISRIIDGITTEEINKLSANLANTKISTSYDYSILAARLTIDNLYKKVSKSFVESTKRLDDYDMLSEKYYDKVMLWGAYLEKELVHSRDFNFDYLGVNNLLKSYLKKYDEEILETPQCMYMRLAVFLSDTKADAIKLYHQFSNHEISPASPIIFNAGTKESTLISCNLVTGLDSVGYNGEYKDPDSLEGLHELYKQASKLSAGAAGLGIDATDIRSKEAIINSSGGKAGGVLKMILKPLNELMRGYNQKGSRPGAAAVYMEPYHMDIEDLLRMKRPSTSVEQACRDLFSAIWMPDLFMSRLEERINTGTGKWTLFDPKSLKDNGYDLHGVYGGEFKRQYELAEKDDKVLKKEVDVKEIWDLITASQMESGVPYILYKDRANESNMQSNIGVLKQSNLCVHGDTLLKLNRSNPKYKNLDCRIKNLINQEVEIWNGYEWSVVTPKLTGYNPFLYEVTFDINDDSDWEGVKSTVLCTDYHRWFMADGSEKRTWELAVGDNLKEYFFNADSLFSKKATLYKIERIVNPDPSNAVYCLTEPKRGTVMFNNIVSSNCSEILEVTDSQTVANCVLSAIPIGKPIYIKDDTINWEKLRDSTHSIVKYLNKICDINAYPTPQARKGGMDQRALGIGLMGLADLFAQLDLAYDSEEALKLSNKISEHMYYYALEASNNLAKKGLLYGKYKGSPYEEGLLHFDKYLENVKLDSSLDWNGLRESIRQFGVANSLLIAQMPTAGSANLISLNEACEPFVDLIYKRTLSSGEFVVVNKHLVKELEDLGFWSDALKNEIIIEESVQNILLERYSSSKTSQIAEEKGFEYITSRVKKIKEKYKTAWELGAKPIINQASGRQPFVDQTQSMNIWMSDPTSSKLTSMFLYGWKQRLKTGSYYIRSSKKSNNKQLAGVQSYSKPPNSEVDCVGCTV